MGSARGWDGKELEDREMAKGAWTVTVGAV